MSSLANPMSDFTDVRNLSPAAGGPAQALAATFASLRGLGITDRRIFDSILREMLDRHPEFVGVWTVWEPNALDGKDRDFSNTPGHDETGRFVPFWNRVGGRIHVEPNVNYDVPGLGDWYLVPTQRRCETVLDPYEVPAAGRPVFITSMVAPILLDGRCVGAAGVDVAIDEVPGRSSAAIEETLKRGFVFLDENGRVEYWSQRTRELLSRYVGRASGDSLPSALAGHLRRLRLKQTRSEELPHFRRGASELHIRFVRHPQRDRFVLVVEESTAIASPEDALSAREREVFEWLGQGKANGEIATILGLSVHTVKRHVERILAKLGVENRCSAALLHAGNAAAVSSGKMGLSTYIARSRDGVSVSA
jgi:DNA-binding CsgD family transcriptional regulator